jgi:hypothetical protein
MLKLLSRRWLGVTGWGYLFSLLLAVGVYWILPTSRAVHQWSFSGIAYVVGFMDQDRTMLVKQIQHDGHGKYKIDLQSGQVERYADPETSGPDDLKQTSKMPYTLMRIVSLANNTPNKLELIDKRNKAIHTIPGDTTYIWLHGGMDTSNGRRTNFAELTTSGSAAMSLDERWLLMTFNQPKLWNSLIAWLREKTGWAWPFDSDGSIHHAIIIDLVNDERTSFPLPAGRVTQFEVHPQGLGFAVLDGNSYSTLPTHQDEKHTMIEWYSLPVGPAHHSQEQWSFILGAFALPIAISLLLSLLGKLRMGKASAITAEAPLSKN